MKEVSLRVIYKSCTKCLENNGDCVENLLTFCFKIHKFFLITYQHILRLYLMCLKILLYSLFKKIFHFRTSVLRSSQNSLHSMNTQRPSSAYYPQSVGNPARPTNLHQSIPNLKSPPSVHRLHNEDNRSGSYPSVNSRNEERPPHYPPNYQGQRIQNEEIKHQHYPSSPHVMSPQYGQNYQSSIQNQGGYSPGGHVPNMPNGQRGHDELIRQPTNDVRYQSNLLREDVFRQSQQGRIEEMRMNANVNGRNEDIRNQMRNEELLRYSSSNNVKQENQARITEELRQQGKIVQMEEIRNSEIVRTGDVMRSSKSEDMLRQHAREDMMRYNSTNNVRSQEEMKTEHYNQKMEDIRQSNITRPDEIIRQTSKNPDEIVRQHPINASLRGQAKMAEMSEEVRRRQNRVNYNQYQPNTSSYQQHQPPNTNYYQQSPNQGYSQQYYNQNTQYSQQNYQQPMSPSYIQTSSAYNQHTPTSANSSVRSYPNTPISQAQSAMQNLSLNTSYPQGPNYNQNNYNYSGPLSPQGYQQKLPPTAPKPNRQKVEEVPPELPPSSTHPLYAASMQEPPKGAFYPNTTVQGKVGPANPWEREEREKEMEVRRMQARQWRDQQIKELGSSQNRTPQQEEQLRALRLEREFERRAQEAEQEDEDADKVRILNDF